MSKIYRGKLNTPFNLKIGKNTVTCNLTKLNGLPEYGHMQIEATLTLGNNTYKYSGRGDYKSTLNGKPIPSDETIPELGSSMDIIVHLVVEKYVHLISNKQVSEEFFDLQGWEIRNGDLVAV